MKVSEAAIELQQTASVEDYDADETAALPALMLPHSAAANSAGPPDYLYETLVESISRLIELVDGIDTKLGRIATALEKKSAPKRQQRKTVTKRKTVRKKSKS